MGWNQVLFGAAAPESSSLNAVPPETGIGNVHGDDVATNENKPLPLIIGEASPSALWIGQVYNQYTVDAPSERPGKK